MLEQLFGSKTRVRLLRLFLNNPKEAFLVRELTRRIGSQINAVRTELKKLQSLELAVEVTDPKAEGLSVDEDGVDGEAEKYEMLFLKAAEVFPAEHGLPDLSGDGSPVHQGPHRPGKGFCPQAGGGRQHLLPGPDRDLHRETEAPTDMLVVGKVNRDRLSALIRSFEKEVGKEINYTVMTPQEFTYRKDVTDRFLYSILEWKKLTVIDTISNAAR